MRVRSWLAILIVFLTVSLVSTLSAQVGPVPRREAAPDIAATSRLAPEAQDSQELRNKHQPPSGWGGPGCAKASDLIAMVDAYLSAPSPAFPDLGSPIAGASMAWRSPDCGAFTYTAGFRNVEKDLRMTPESRMSIASMTKAVMSAITLRLMEQGAFGRRGLDSTVDRLLPPAVIAALTVGDDPANPQCPGETYLYDRLAESYEWTAFECPDLSQVTLRDLLRGNHGMYDFLNEVLLPDGTSRYERGAYSEIYDYLGFPPLEPVNSKNGLDYLKAFGLKRAVSAVIGGTSLRDFEISFGNTGFQLLGAILEHRTGQRLDVLIHHLVTGPLDIEPMEIYLHPQPQRFWADGYDMNTGDPNVEQSGVYPLVNLNGHTAVNVRDLGLGRPANVNMAGGTGALIATPRSYAVFLEALTSGRLLGRVAQRELDTSYVAIDELDFPDYDLSNGFGLIKEITQGFPGAADYQLLNHSGALPGARCVNAVVERPAGNSAPLTGVLCVNSRGLAPKNLQSFWYDLLNVIADPATYGSP